MLAVFLKAFPYYGRKTLSKMRLLLQKVRAKMKTALLSFFHSAQRKIFLVNKIFQELERQNIMELINVNTTSTAAAKLSSS